MTVLVYGLGRSGLSVLRLLVPQGHPVEFFEQRADGPDVSEALNLGARRLKNVAESDASVVIPAPGVPIDHHDLLTPIRREQVRMVDGHTSGCEHDAHSR